MIFKNNTKYKIEVTEHELTIARGSVLNKGEEMRIVDEQGNNHIFVYDGTVAQRDELMEKGKREVK